MTNEAVRAGYARACRYPSRKMREAHLRRARARTATLSLRFSRFAARERPMDCAESRHKRRLRRLVKSTSPRCSGRGRIQVHPTLRNHPALMWRGGDGGRFSHPFFARSSMVMRKAIRGLLCTSCTWNMVSPPLCLALRHACLMRAPYLLTLCLLLFRYCSLLLLSLLLRLLRLLRQRRRPSPSRASPSRRASRRGTRPPSTGRRPCAWRATRSTRASPCLRSTRSTSSRSSSTRSRLSRR